MTFKKGPDYIDPKWLAEASGNQCFNLDFNAMTEAEIMSLYCRHINGMDMVVVEGNKGLYDGTNIDGSNCNAALAKLLNLPIILVIDTIGMTRGVAPLLMGYQQFDKDINIQGVILNKVGGERHEGKLINVIEHYTDIKVYGSVRKSDEINILERHLGLMPCNEHGEAEKIINIISNQIADQVDLKSLMSISTNEIISQEKELPIEENREFSHLTIGVMQDSVFGFYYQSDIDEFINYGVKIITINSIEDQFLPSIDALFIGGGFPESYLEKLESNTSLKSDIKEFIENDGVVYAECGGLMYLASSVEINDIKYEMVNAIPAKVIMHKKPIGRGYVKIQQTNEHLWNNISQESNKIINAHEFHYSSIELLSNNVSYGYKVKRGYGVDGNSDGIVYKNTLASYCHLRNSEKYPWVKQFLLFIKNVNVK